RSRRTRLAGPPEFAVRRLPRHRRAAEGGGQPAEGSRCLGRGGPVVDDHIVAHVGGSGDRARLVTGAVSAAHHESAVRHAHTTGALVPTRPHGIPLEGNRGRRRHMKTLVNAALLLIFVSTTA